MLPRLPLDDRTYAEIVQQSRRMIPKRVPEWTDENAHDPGITFIELFAWLTEMQRYYISRVPDKHRRKFLDLLGITPVDALSAQAILQFANVTKPVALPRGTKLLAEDQMFETEASLSMVPLALDRIVCRTEQEANDVTASNEHTNIAFYPFGTDAKVSSKLYLSFDRELAAGEEITINIKLTDSLMSINDDSKRHQGVDYTDLLPSASLSWKAYCCDAESESASWVPLEVVQDETLHLTLSGNLTLRNNQPMRTVIVHPASDRARYWICCTVEEAGYELPPRISALMLHTVNAIQRDTLCEAIDISVEGIANEGVVVDSYLSLYGRVRVQVRDSNQGWRYWEEVEAFSENRTLYNVPNHYTILREPSSGRAVIQFSDGINGSVPPPGLTVRVIASESEFDRHRLVGRSNGLPGQIFDLYDLPCKKRSALLLQTGVSTADATMLWEDWTFVEDFEHSGPSDRHYIYDPIKRKLYFGNGERGAIPQASHVDNIALIGCELGGGERGNVKPQVISEWVNKSQKELGLVVSNPFYAIWGSEAETLMETMQRAQVEIKQSFRAVTNEDYEIIVRSTPGVSVARVHAIPLYKPGLADYPRETAAGQVTVVVVPHSHSDTPTPSKGFLQTVKRYLESRRLITTEVHVIPPLYIKVTVHAVVVVEPQFIDEGDRLLEQLKNLLRPLESTDGAAGWTFGRSVYKGDIYNALSGGNGVLFIQDLWLHAEGAHVTKSAGGDIILPPHGLVYSGQHEIELISRTHL